MTTRADTREPGEAREDRKSFPGISRPGLTTVKGVSISTQVADAKSVRELAFMTQQALSELLVAVNRRLNEISVYVDQTGAQKRDVG